MQALSIIDRIEIDVQTGNVGVRLRKQIVDDEGRVLSSEFHRTIIDASTDPAAQMAEVNAHLDMMGFPAVRKADRDVLDAVMPTLDTVRAQKAQDARDAAAELLAARVKR